MLDMRPGPCLDQSMNQTPVPYVPAVPHPWQPFVPANPTAHAAKMKEQYGRIMRYVRTHTTFARPPVMARPEEVKEEAALAARHNDDESIIDVDTDVQTISPQLAAIIKPTGKALRIKSDDGILSSSERVQLAQDRLAHRIAQDLTAARAHTPFALIPYQATG